MDLEEWELIPRDESSIHHQHDTIPKLSNTQSFIEMNYFQNSLNHTAVIHGFKKNDQIYKDGSDQQTTSRVFDSKMEENKIVDIKMESLKSENNEFTSQVELEEKDGEEGEGEVIKKEKGNNDKNNGGLNNVLEWAMNGIGAVFSFGFVLASVSLIALSNRSSNAHEKRMKREAKREAKRVVKRVAKRTKRLN